MPPKHCDDAGKYLGTVVVAYQRSLHVQDRHADSCVLAVHARGSWNQDNAE